MLRGGCSCRRIIPLRLALQAADQGVFRLKHRVLAPQNSIFGLKRIVFGLKRSLFGLHLRFERGVLRLQLRFVDPVFGFHRCVFDPDLRP